ncbi:MAG: radical SAM protein [Ignavibacteria bacterium]
MIHLNHLNYYRLPWNLTDNAISWLEPTYKCNLACVGCYRQNVAQHKSLEQIKLEIETFKRLRNTDVISIAGGDPLLHPQIVDIVRYISDNKIKPIVNTNGLALDKNLLKELKDAGVVGFTFHVDSKQNRPGWKTANEIELNELRYQYARMLADEGNISCSFNSTVYEDTMQYIPEMLKWAERNIDIVQVMVFIIYRAVENDDMDYYAGLQKINVSELVYNEKDTQRIDIKAEEIYEIIKFTYQDFDCCAYLNGSEKPDSFKWFLGGRLGTKGKIYGYLGSKTMEIIQVLHHMFFNTYLGYSRPKYHKVRLSLLPLTPFDKKLRRAFKNYLRNPFRIFKPLYYQSVMIIQPIDILEDGRQSMCDGCPDITVWNGQLVWSCRLEEQLKYGINLRSLPKNLHSDN